MRFNVSLGAEPLIIFYYSSLHTAGKSCGDPPEVTGSTADFDGNRVGDVANYIAKPGYRLSGSVSLTCLNTQKWEPSGQPTAQSKRIKVGEMCNFLFYLFTQL